jgi:hypothetical protein
MGSVWTELENHTTLPLKLRLATRHSAVSGGTNPTSLCFFS